MPEPLKARGKQRANYAVGVDVGGTKIAAGVVSIDDGAIVAARKMPTGAARGGEPVLRDVVTLLDGLVCEAVGMGIKPVSVGVGIAELVDPDGRLKSEATIRWLDIPVIDRIAAAVALPVVFEADVRAAARAEAQFGAGAGRKSFLYVSIGTGISCSLVIDGKPYVGARGLTGTFASSRAVIPTDDGTLAEGPPLESFGSGPGVAHRMRIRDPRFSGRSYDVFRLAAENDPVAVNVVELAGKSVGVAIARLVDTFDPEIVVLGGGMSAVVGLYRESLEAGVRNFVWSVLHQNIPIVSAHLDVDSGVVGAALASIDRTE